MQEGGWIGMASSSFSGRVAALLETLTDSGAVEPAEVKHLKAEVRRVSSRRAWDKANLRTVSTKLTVDEDRRFRRYCQACGMTRYEVLQGLVRTVIRSV